MTKIKKITSKRNYLFILTALLLGTFLIIANIGTIQDIRNQAQTVNSQPTDYLRAFTGGNNIAILWDPSPSTSASVSGYILYKDGEELAQVDPADRKNQFSRGVLRYYDNDVQEGQTYTYEVAALVNGTPSKKSAAITVTHETCTPVPQVTINTEQAPELAEYANTIVKQHIETWYPKVADLIANPGYQARQDLVVKFYPFEGVANAANGKIDVNSEWMVNNKKDIAMFTHELTHTVTFDGPPSYEGDSGWVVEGTADWINNYVYGNEAAPKPKAEEGYKKGYEKAAYFFQWITKNYEKPDFVRDLNIAKRNKKYNDNLFIQYTGKTVDQLWEEMQAAPEDPSINRFPSNYPPCSKPNTSDKRLGDGKKARQKVPTPTFQCIGPFESCSTADTRGRNIVQGIRIEMGGGPYTDKKNNLWEADSGFDGGNTIDRGTIPITATDDPKIYQTEHWTFDPTMTFRRKIPNGRYIVKLHFAETYKGTYGPKGELWDQGIDGPEKRVFRIEFEGNAFEVDNAGNAQDTQETGADQVNQTDNTQTNEENTQDNNRATEVPNQPAESTLMNNFNNFLRRFLSKMSSN